MELESPRLRLRRVSDDEARVLVSGRAPGSIACAAGYPTADTPDAFSGQLLGRDEFGPWLIVRARDGRAIGNIGLAPWTEPGTYTGGYGIAETARGQGFATEALTAVLAALWEQRPDARRVLLDTAVSNRASSRVMEKAGLRPAGQLRGSCFYVVERNSLGAGA